MGLLGLPEMIMIGIIALLIFGPKLPPHLPGIIDDARRSAEDRGYTLSLIFAFALFLIVAFIYMAS
jgi:hypothetical protein